MHPGRVCPGVAMFCPACQCQKPRRFWYKEQWNSNDPTGKWLGRCGSCDPHRVGRTLAEAEQCLQMLDRCVAFMNQNTNARNGVKRFLDRWLTLPWETRKYLSYFGALRRSPNHPMDDAGNAMYLILWHLFLPEVLVRHHLRDLETVGDLWESIFGYTLT